MSDQPPPAIGTASASVPDPAATPSGPGWLQRLSSVLIIIFCLELGLFLLIYPWTDAWSDNYFAWAVQGSARMAWHSFWANSYVRGGVSGMGAVNLWIAVAEVFRLFARRAANRS
jgi:hypothetical protein